MCMIICKLRNVYRLLFMLPIFHVISISQTIVTSSIVVPPSARRTSLDVEMASERSKRRRSADMSGGAERGKRRASETEKVITHDHLTHVEYNKILYLFEILAINKYNCQISLN